MAFRIRNLDLEAGQAFQACEEAYQKHLESFEEHSHSNLWKYFATDFFHHGAIRSICFSPCLKSLVMQIECPNIKRTMKDHFDYISMDFICEFRGVRTFTLQNENPDLVDTIYADSSQFVGSEINTAIPQKINPEKIHSLTIEALEGNRRIWIDLLFSNMSVSPEEPTAYSILESDSRFHIPTYTPSE